jgi:signal transduction histidine kinase
MRLLCAAGGALPSVGHNGCMNDVTAVTESGRLRQLLAFARAAEPRTPLPRRSAMIDIAIAAVVLAVSLAIATVSLHGGYAAAVLTSVPLAARRRYPLTAFLVVLTAAIALKNQATDVTFLAIVFAGYSAALHSRFRGAALLVLAPAGVLVAAEFWSVADRGGSFAVVRNPVGYVGALGRPVPVLPASAPGLPGLSSAAAGPTRVGGLLVLVSLVSIAIFGAVMYAGDRIRRLQAEHQTATGRALRLERARIASELHDVVTHNVSVMIIQAGAARQVLAESPGDARQALLAVEASGRAAMTELRHLLGLLSPAAAPDAGATDSAGPTDSADPVGENLRPQPGLEQLRPLIDRVAAAGLPVDLQISGGLHDLPPGLDLAVFRVVQEALTNVLKHAGKPKTTVRLDLTGTELVVDIADSGPPIPAAAPVFPAGRGRGLLGLRERIAIYGGELDAGPRLGGGWRVTARLPVDQSPEPGAPAAGEAAGSPANGAAAFPAPAAQPR